MRLPWLQVEQDGIAQCKRLAGLLGIPAAQGIGIGVLAWQYALEISPEGDFRGFVPDPGILAIEVGWPEADAANLVTQLQRVGIIATAPALRVRGLDRYIRAWEKNTGKKAIYRDCGEAVPEPGANPAPVAPVPARQTHTQIHTKEKIPPKKPATPKALTDPRHAPLVAAIDLAFQAQHGRKYPFEPRDFARVKALLPRGTSEELVEAWRKALSHAGFPTIATLEDFGKHLPRFIGTGPPTRAADSRAPAPVADWTQATTGEIPA